MNIVASYASKSKLYHIGIRDGAVYRLRCGRTIKSDGAAVLTFRVNNIRHCVKCGNFTDFEEIKEKLDDERQRRDEQHKARMEAGRQRLKLRNEQRRYLAPTIRMALDRMPEARNIEIEYFRAGAELAGEFVVDEQIHKFTLTLKR